MNTVTIIIIIGIFIALITIGLYFWLRKKEDKMTYIIFQTSCDIKFLLTEKTQLGETVAENFLFSPKTNYTYEADELARDMTNEANEKGFPLSLTFEDGRFKILCTDVTKEFYIVDQEFDTTLTGIQGQTFISQYGAAQRFLNHLYIYWEISYFPDDKKTSRAQGQSTQDLRGMTISLQSIPVEPTNLIIRAADYNSMSIEWTPTPGTKTGIYLKHSTEDYFQNWELFPANITTYTFEGLISGDTYTVGISSVGKFDESSIVASNPVTIPVPPITINTLEFVNDLNRSQVNKLKPGNIIYNTWGIATDFSTHTPIVWPTGLTKQSQILNIKVKYYTQLTGRYYNPTLPSDSRIEMEEGATLDGTAPSYRLLDYMYWKTVIPETPIAPNAYIFGSTNFNGGNQGGPSLPWETLIITDPNTINSIFPADSSGNIISKLAPNLRFYCGYLSNQIQIDNAQVPIQTYSIDWQTL